MPAEIPQFGNRNAEVRSRVDELDQQAASYILLGLSVHVEGKEGVLKLVHSDDPPGGWPLRGRAGTNFTRAGARA